MYVHKNSKYNFYILMDCDLRFQILEARKILTAIYRRTNVVTNLFGADSFYLDESQRVRGLVFKDKPHREFKVKNRLGYSVPKPGSQAEKAIASIPQAVPGSETLLNLMGPINAGTVKFMDGAELTEETVVVVGQQGVQTMGYSYSDGVVGIFLPDTDAVEAEFRTMWNNIIEVNFDKSNVLWASEKVTENQYAAITKHDWTLPYHYAVEEREASAAPSTVWTEYDVTFLEFNTVKVFQDKPTEEVIADALHELIMLTAETSKRLPKGWAEPEDGYAKETRAIRPKFFVSDALVSHEAVAE